MRWRDYILQILCGVIPATVACWLCGFLLVWIGVSDVDSFAIGPTFMLPIAFGLIAGSVASYCLHETIGRWAWVPFSCFFTWCLLVVAIRHGTKSAFIEFFGSIVRDSDSQVLDQFLVTSPFMVSVAYSLVTYIHVLIQRRKQKAHRADGAS